MATLTVRDLDDDVKARLRVRAARHGRSMEAEVRAILDEALSMPEETGGMGTRIHELFARIGGAELDVQARDGEPRAADFGP